MGRPTSVVVGPALSADGRGVFPWPTQAPFITPTHGGKEWHLTLDKRQISSALWTPDGHRILFPFFRFRAVPHNGLISASGGAPVGIRGRKGKVSI